MSIGGWLKKEAVMPLTEAKWWGDVLTGKESLSLNSHNKIHADSTTELGNGWVQKHPDATAAAIVASIFGGAALAGGGAAGGAGGTGAGASGAGGGGLLASEGMGAGATAGTNMAGFHIPSTATYTSTTAMPTAQFGGLTSGAAQAPVVAQAPSAGGGLLATTNQYAQTAGNVMGAANQAKGLMTPQSQPVQASPVMTGGGGSQGLSSMVSQQEQATQQRISNEQQMRIARQAILQQMANRGR